MSKTKVQAESIYNLSNYLKKDSIQPIYFFFGEDLFTIDQAVKEVVKMAEPFIESDFDRETINIENKQSIISILDIASAFPFGSGKKVIVAKNFEKISDKKNLTSYINDPVDSTILIITNIGRISDLSKEPFSGLVKYNFIFEAKELKGRELARWVVKQAEKEKMVITAEDAFSLVEIVGEDKALLEMQLLKFRDYLGDSHTITLAVIEKLASNTKEYNIFNLQDALGSGDKKRVLEIGYNLIDNGTEMLFVTNMLTRYFTTILRSLELTSNKVQDNEAAREIGVSYFYYKNCRNARYFLSFERLRNASKALLNADVAIKTSAASKKNIYTQMIAEIFLS